ncbi:MAG: sugar-binding transcriptional regulator [Rhodobacteraceae bacterium]|nr:sugar-binding transcriptional regulator [Paracoccaceae bacterium]
MNMLSDNQQMTRAAWLYYVGGLNQEATSKRMGLTRARVNKLLSQARDTGLVSIVINERDVGLLAEEEAIRAEFGLEFCLTTPKIGLSEVDASTEARIVFSMVGAAAAQYLRDRLTANPELIVGTGWGRTLEHVSRNLSGIAAPNAKFFSLMGSLTSNSSFNPFEVVHAIAQATGAEGYFLPAPFIADSESDREVFLSQRGISETMELAKRADLAFVSVGELTETSLLRTQNMISEEEVTTLRDLGAVGDTNGIFFDQNGKTVDHDLNRRIVAIGLTLLARTKTIVLSAGRRKLSATMAILRSGAIKGLIIDGDSAVHLYQSIQKKK